MTVPTAVPVPPVPAVPPAQAPTSPPSRRPQAVVLLLLIVAGTLVAWRWYSDRYGTRPTELHRGIDYQVDLNRATRSELMQVPGIGSQLADRIVAHREGHGRFHRVEDLDAVPGIGNATVGRIRPWVTVLAAEPGEAAIVPDRLTRKQSTASPTAATPGIRLINVNIATLDELNTLPNIGPVLAQRMIDERQKRPFVNVEDLGRVSGIGPKRREALRDRVVFD
jgi:competence ComEA-like helix-hairpin-helix protein